MKHRLYIATLFIGITLAASCPTLAQNNTDSVSSEPPTSAVAISSSVTARVFIDGDSVGTTPLTFQSKPGKRIIKLVSDADVNSWSSDPIVDTITVQPNSPLTLRYELSRKILLNSVPTGAEVFSNDSLLGTTPLIVRTKKSSFTFRKVGFEEQTFSPSEQQSISVALKKKWESGADSSIFQTEVESRSSARLYISAATTVLAGAASAYFKVKADNSYSDYVRTGNPSQLSDTDRYDAAATVAIAATQISLGLFTYFILTE